MSTSILIINPNSTVAMTDALIPIVAPLLPANTTATYFTAPPSAPPSINDKATSQLSAEICLPALLPLLPDHAAFLVSCYSDHPLVPLLRAHTRKPVLGIFEASIYHSLSLLTDHSKKFAIVTTGKAWEALLTEGVSELLGGAGRLGSVESTGLDADQLHRVSREELERRMKEATKRALEGSEVEVICLGCAGMVGLKDLVLDTAREVGKVVRVVDGVEAGVGVVGGLEGRGYEL